MYEYTFKVIPLTTLKSEPLEDYHDVIHEYAAVGWKLVQIFAPSTKSNGMAGYFELIFEREK
ncbi:DUF4177 domain-containing protein [Alkalihalobacillus trypoxylicola]|uniref:DUF4177 domain-containing protein n=1 Tax=Alkalihalobacillus trypoxylicola TaxID=519424 RepID=A0A161PGQ3_9BACI|nr:DUF4177 domain-containing protein [Alkalihalobacillus trypoxylicola]KYG31964.1 hypothetical protein AZF04_04095 [Alkalihalobacillus trypoxylicola]GAF65811.1 putative acetyltransferase [Bacillus sp. TS-2]